jgi:hypothetical protein
MASLSATNVTTNSVTVSISGLTYPADQYGGFRFSKNAESLVYSDTTSCTFSGLSPNTQYSFYSEAKWGDDWHSSGSCTVTTQALIVPSQPTNISHSVYENTCTISFTKGTNASYTKLSYWLNSDPVTFNWNTTTTGSSFSLSGLNYNDSYSYQLMSYSSDGESSGYTSTRSFTTGNPPTPTPPLAPTISIDSNGTTPSVWIKVYRVANTTGSSVSTFISKDNITFYTVSEYANQFGASIITAEPYVTISNLQSDTTYYFKAKAYKDGLESVWSSTVSQKTGIGKPPSFSWTTTIASGQPFSIKADDWNLFRTNIDSMRRYKGLTVYGFGSPPVTDDDFYYSEFNAVRNALYALRTYMTGSYANGALMPSTVSTDSDVYASFFINLAGSYNSIT